MAGLADLLMAAGLAYAGGTTPGVAQGYNQWQAGQQAEKQKKQAEMLEMIKAGYQPYQRSVAGKLQRPQLGAIPANVLDFPVGGQRYWEPTVKAKEQEPKDFLKYFKPLSGKLEEGESPPPGAIKAPDFMKQYFPDVDYYMYQQPKVLDLGAFF